MSDSLTKMFLRLLPCLYAIAVFIAMLDNSFWLDDYGWVSNAMHAARDASYLVRPVAGFFRPIVNVVFMINFLVAKLAPSCYYLVNLALHLANALLVFQLVYLLSEGSLAVACLSSLFFAGAVGNYGEAVMWISGRTELVATLFYLGALIYFWHFLHGQRWYDYGLTIACFILALLSKESAVSLLPALVTLEWLGTRKSLKAVLTLSRLKWYLPFGLLLIPYLWYELNLQQLNYVVYEHHYRFGWHVICNWLEYLTLMILPVTAKSTIVQMPPAVRSTLSLAQMGLMLGLTIIWTSILLFARSPLKFTVLWMNLAILPYAFFTWKTTTRYLYIPSIGFVTAAAFLIAMLSNRLFSGRSRQCWIKVLGVLVLVVLLGLQWMVVNYVERQWSILQFRQDRTAYDNLLSLAKELGY